MAGEKWHHGPSTECTLLLVIITDTILQKIVDPSTSIIFKTYLSAYTFLKEIYMHLFTLSAKSWCNHIQVNTWGLWGGFLVFECIWEVSEVFHIVKLLQKIGKLLCYRNEWSRITNQVSKLQFLLKHKVCTVNPWLDVDLVLF